MKNVFNPQDVNQLLERIEKLSSDTQQQWGKMDASQMLAHCNVTYEMVYTDKHPKPNAVVKFILKTFIKNKVVSETPYQKNGKTAPQFVMKSDKDFNAEKKRLIAYIKKTQELGAAHFDNKESHSFGKLSSAEWNNMFYKHLDHHLNQFGV
ncbi:MAG TPA: DUF1569 domain-containing protein [Flavobacteriia bacterium]|nr:DUF1569 domain-containing protein [Flavobacteriia bacterium]